MTDGTNNAMAAGAGQERSAEEIRTEIEHTRAQLGETVEALAEKTDVKAHAHDRIEAAKGAVAANLGMAREKADGLVSRARESAPDSPGTGVEQVTATVRQKPLPFAAAGAFVAGLLVARVLRRR